MGYSFHLKTKASIAFDADVVGVGVRVAACVNQ